MIAPVSSKYFPCHFQLIFPPTCVLRSSGFSFKFPMATRTQSLLHCLAGRSIRLRLTQREARRWLSRPFFAWLSIASISGLSGVLPPNWSKQGIQETRTPSPKGSFVPGNHHATHPAWPASELAMPNKYPVAHALQIVHGFFPNGRSPLRACSKGSCRPERAHCPLVNWARNHVVGPPNFVLALCTRGENGGGRKTVRISSISSCSL